MAKTKERILEELDLTYDSSSEEILEKLDEYVTIKDSELNAIKSISVKTLPTKVVNQEEMVKRRMYGIVTDEDRGMASIINKRMLLIRKILSDKAEVSALNDTKNRVTNLEISKADKTEIPTKLSQLEQDIVIVGGISEEKVNEKLASKADITYVDNKFDQILGEGASKTLDTIGEIARAFEEHQEVTEALNSAIGNKADKTEIPTKLSDLEIDIEVGGGVDETEVLEIIEENSETTEEIEVVESETLNIGTSDNYDETSDSEVPTTKAVKTMIDSNSSGSSSGGLTLFATATGNATFDLQKEITDGLYIINAVDDDSGHTYVFILYVVTDMRSSNSNLVKEQDYGGDLYMYFDLNQSISSLYMVSDSVLNTYTINVYKLG
jgi:hypothetical protein